MEQDDFTHDDDDDFGELYADLQVLATPPPPPPQQHHDNDDGSGGGGDSNNNDDDTESEDGLNIVLNDDDCPAACVEDVVHPERLDNNQEECIDQEQQFVSSDAQHCGQSSKNCVRGGYGSQFFRSKFMKTQGSMFVNNIMANKSMGLTKDCSSFAQGRGDSFQNHKSSSSYFAGSFLPWHWKIYDVNIDKFEEKPWRIPGADITDYFNFGLNENTWKQYCSSLASTQEQFDQPVSGSLLSHSSKCEVPMGRAIQVGDSVVDRQPSVDVRRPRSIDSDVIIQINVHGSSDNTSAPVKCNVLDSSEKSELISGVNINKSNSSSEHDVLSDEQLEDAKQSEVPSGQERNDLDPDVVKIQNPDEEDRYSEDGKVLEEEIKTEGRVCIDTCSEDPGCSEPELSLGDQELSLTSYSDNDSEGTEDSLHVYNERKHSPLRSHLVSSDTGLKESLPLYEKTSRKISVNRKPVNTSYYSRNRGPVQQDQRHQTGRHMPGSKLQKHMENDNNVSHIPRSSGRNLSSRCHRFVNYRSDERLQYFGSHERKDVPYDWETKQSCYYGTDRNVDDLDQAVYSEYSDREYEDRFREDKNQYIRKSGDKREYFFERRTLIKYNEDDDWDPASRKQYVDDDLSLLSYRESRQFHSRHSSFPAKDREAQRQIMHHRRHFKDRNCDSDQWFDDEFEFLNKSYRYPSSFAEREMESLNNRHEEQFLQIDRAQERYTGRGRHHDRASIDVDTPWSGRTEDEFPKYAHNQNSYLKYQRQSYTDSARNYMHREDDSFRGHETHNHATNRGNDWQCGYTDAAEDEGCTTSPVDECEFYPLPYEVSHWTNNDNIVWNHDDMHPEDDTLFYEEPPMHERHARNRSLHARVQRNDIKLQQHQLNFSRKGGDIFIKRSSKVMSRDHSHPTVLRCNKSGVLINREGKSAKGSRLMRNDTLQNVDRGIAEKRKALVGFDDSRKKAIKLDVSKSQRVDQNKKLLQNLSDKGQKEGLDVEEGEIVTEEPSVEVSVSRRVVSEDATLAESVKKRISQNGNNSEPQIGNLDSQKILDTLAKMEKRRERFKQPIGMNKEAVKQPIGSNNEVVKSLKLNTDSAVDIGEIKQQRPVRKRRWNG